METEAGRALPSAALAAEDEAVAAVCVAPPRLVAPPLMPVALLTITIVIMMMAALTMTHRQMRPHPPRRPHRLHGGEGEGEGKDKDAVQHAGQEGGQIMMVQMAQQSAAPALGPLIPVLLLEASLLHRHLLQPLQPRVLLAGV